MEAGIFNSPDYPFHTGSSLNCGWTFRVRPGYGILFNFTEFNTSIGRYESMTSQFADWMKVRFAIFRIQSQLKFDILKKMTFSINSFMKRIHLEQRT